MLISWNRAFVSNNLQEEVSDVHTWDAVSILEAFQAGANPSDESVDELTANGGTLWYEDHTGVVDVPKGLSRELRRQLRRLKQRTFKRKKNAILLSTDWSDKVEATYCCSRLCIVILNTLGGRIEITSQRLPWDDEDLAMEVIAVISLWRGERKDPQWPIGSDTISELRVDWQLRQLAQQVWLGSPSDVSRYDEIYGNHVLGLHTVRSMKLQA